MPSLRRTSFFTGRMYAWRLASGNADVDQVVARAVRMVAESRVIARNGAEIRLNVDTICVHGDNPQALAFVRALR